MKHLRYDIALAFVAVFGLTTNFSLSAEVHDAVVARDMARLKNLLAQGGMGIVHEKKEGGITPLHLAAVSGFAEAVPVLVESGADANARTDNGFTPLHWAARRDSLGAAMLLIDNGADVNAKTSSGVTPLHWAAKSNASRVTKLLLVSGADVQAQTVEGATALHWAVQNNAVEAAVILAKARDASQADGPAPSASSTKNAAAGVSIPEPAVKMVFGKPITLPLGDGVVLELVWVEQAKIWVAKYETTNAQFRKHNPSHISGSYVGRTLDGDNSPAVNVTWHEADRFCDWLNGTFGGSLPAGFECRLPLESEWEVLARCGDARMYPWGDQWPPVCGNYADESARSVFPDWVGIEGYQDGFPVTCPATESGMNEWGLYGIGGNVWEWCNDWHDSAKSYKARRGGEWCFSKEVNMRVNFRGFDKPDGRYDTVGFRVVIGRKL